MIYCTHHYYGIRIFWIWLYTYLYQCVLYFHMFFKKSYLRIWLLIFWRERETDRQTERHTSVWKRNINPLPLICAPTGDQTYNLGMCPDRESNPQPFGVWDDATPSNWTICPGLQFHMFFFKILIFYCYSITVVCLFSPSLHSTPAEPPSSPTSTLPLDFVHVSFSSSCKPLSPLSPPYSPLSIVRLFITSMSLVIFCFPLFFSIYYVPVKGEIIWYLSLIVWLISLNIMLSSSIRAVAKGISSFFLSIT